MTHIQIKKGLDIPLIGKPHNLLPNKTSIPSKLALDLHSFPLMRLRSLVKVGQMVKTGEPILQDKENMQVFFTSPCTGTIVEIQRGEKKAICCVVIQVAEEEIFFDHGKLIFDTKDQILDNFCKIGLIPHIRMRPLDILARPDILPKKIFINAAFSAPFTPSAKMQIENHLEEFQGGIDTLNKLIDGTCNLVYNDSFFASFKDVTPHTIEGPHPSGNSSIHIHHIDPIKSKEDIIWTLSALDVLCIGYFILHNKPYTDRIISLAGEGFLKEKRGFLKTKVGMPISDLIEDSLLDKDSRLISGDPLMGKEVTKDGFIGFSHLCLCSILKPEPKREFLSFFRLGLKKYTASKTYFNWRKKLSLTTASHGEKRAFIDPSIYDKYLPMKISTVFLIKAILAKDFDKAVDFGLLEVSPEDFALASFVCPSKIEMTQIIEKGLKEFSEEILK